LSWFVAMIYSRGGREIETTMVTHEMQRFLDRFMPPEDNSVGLRVGYTSTTFIVSAKNTCE
jgi:hypothetical protein